VKKIAIFVEGETELIFVRHLLLKLFDNYILKFECIRLLSGGKTARTPFDFSSPNPKIYFQVISVGNDYRVLSVIKDREKSLIEDSFDTIVGLRDMYSQEYKKLSRNIDESVTKQFIDKSNETIRKTNNPSKIKLHFAIISSHESDHQSPLVGIFRNSSRCKCFTTSLA
jgi:predicted ATP-dependent endonuclease of OLD family